MDKKSTTFGSRSEKLAELLSLAGQNEEDAAELSEAEAKAELLHDVLATPMPLTDPYGKQHAGIGHTLDVLSGEPLGKPLLDPELDMALLQRIKDYGRSLSISSKSRIERHV